jgi:hypothetical protein
MSVNQQQNPLETLKTLVLHSLLVLRPHRTIIICLKVASQAPMTQLIVFLNLNFHAYKIREKALYFLSMKTQD